MNRINDILGYLRDRIAEPGSQRAMALAFGLAGVTVTDLSSQIALAALTLVTTTAAVFLKEKAAVITTGSTSPISAIAFKTLTDLLGQGPAVERVAQQVYALHADGKLDANEMLTILGGLNTVASGVAATQLSDPAVQLVPAGLVIVTDPAPAPAVAIVPPPAPPAVAVVPQAPQPLAPFIVPTGAAPQPAAVAAVAQPIPGAPAPLTV